MTKDEIQQIIPHRDPFLLIDEITSLIPRESATGIKRVSVDDFWVPGHFPQEAVMPGVLIIEALAQVGAVILLSADENKGKVAYFAGIEKARFRRKVIPGDVLELSLRVTKMRGPFGYGEAVARVGDQIVCETTCSFALG